MFLSLSRQILRFRDAIAVWVIQAEFLICDPLFPSFLKQIAGSGASALLSPLYSLISSLPAPESSLRHHVVHFHTGGDSLYAITSSWGPRAYLDRCQLHVSSLVLHRDRRSVSCPPNHSSSYCGWWLSGVGSAGKRSLTERLEAVEYRLSWGSFQFLFIGLSTVCFLCTQPFPQKIRKFTLSGRALLNEIVQLSIMELASTCSHSRQRRVDQTEL